MSHVATVDIEVKDLLVLRSACERIGLELVVGQQTYRWWGKHVGDYPVPEGFTVEDLGKCDHAVRVRGNATAYEIGVVKRRDGRPGYTLLWDFAAGGKGLEEAVGENCNRLKQAYGVEAAKYQARQQGFSCREIPQTNGAVRLVLSK